jgi:hypothetical protein
MGRRPVILVGQRVAVTPYRLSKFIPYLALQRIGGTSEHGLSTKARSDIDIPAFTSQGVDRALHASASTIKDVGVDHRRL